MSAHATIQTQHQTVQVLGPNAVRDVMEVGFSTTPSDVYAVARVPLPFWKQFGSTVYVEQIASLIEGAIARGNVAGAAYAEDLDANGLVAAFVDFTVEITPPNINQVGPMQAIARVPITRFTDDIAPAQSVYGIIDETVAALERTASE